MKLSFLLAWYDMWVGAFWDKKKKWLYIFFIPCLGIIIKIIPRCRGCRKILKFDGKVHYCIHCNTDLESF